MKREIAECMLGYWPISERLIMMKIQGAPFNINIIQGYALTSEHPDDEVDKFYDSIEEAMKHARSAEVDVLMGDLNAKIGNQHQYPVTGRFGLGEWNDRGTELANF